MNRDYPDTGAANSADTHTGASADKRADNRTAAGVDKSMFTGAVGSADTGSASAAAPGTPATALADLRKDYSRASLSKQDVSADPFAQFAVWFREASDAQLAEPNAMTLATVGANGRPSSRIVLIKQFDAQGFTWFTNYASRKGLELEGDGAAPGHPYAALLFHWVELERQVRIEGRVERIAGADSDAYFHSRPLKSRLGAIASDQSRTVADRATLEARFSQAEQDHGDRPERPADWGGYRLVPDYFEFWQGRRSRLHDRIVYRAATGADGTDRPSGAWTLERLQP